MVAVAGAVTYLEGEINGIHGGKGGSLEIRQCQNWGPNPDDFANSEALSTDATINGSSDSATPTKVCYLEVDSGIFSTPTITVSGHVEIHCRYLFRAKLVANYESGPVSVTVYAGQSWDLPTQKPYLDTEWWPDPADAAHSIELEFTPESDEQKDAGSFAFITSDCEGIGLEWVEANGGDGKPGQAAGAGGTCFIQTPGEFGAYKLELNGGAGGPGSSTSMDAGKGGAGGEIAISARHFNPSHIETGGGAGGTSFNRSSHGGDGGDGGKIALHDLRSGSTSSDMTLLASGGIGGDAYPSADFYPYIPQTGRGGKGGNGGSIRIDYSPQDGASYRLFVVRANGSNGGAGCLKSGDGGLGGRIELSTEWPCVLADTTLEAKGGNGASGWDPYRGPDPYRATDGSHGGHGGHGGLAKIQGGFSPVRSSLNLNGGNGATGRGGGYSFASGGRGGNGGDGGNGGRGGVYNDNEWGYPGVPGAGGNGGNGGAASQAAGGPGGNGGRGGSSASPNVTPGAGGAAGSGGTTSVGFPTGPSGQPGDAGTVQEIPRPDPSETLAPDFDDPRNDNIPTILIPGIAASHLFANGEELWPVAFSPSAIARLALLPGPSNIIATDVIREAYGRDFYGKIIDNYISRGYDEFDLEDDPDRIVNSYLLTPNRFRHKPSLFVFPYDWRQDNRDTAQRLKTYIAHIRQLHDNGKVRVVCHSMGGLVFRQWMEDDPLASTSVEAVVTINTPFWGTPSCLYRMLHGDFFGIWPIDSINNSSIRMVVPSFPGARQLLPSPLYFQTASVPVFVEQGWDINGNHQTQNILGVEQVAAHLQANSATLINLHVDPYVDNRGLHTPGFDNWSGSGSGIRMLHLVGIQTNEEKTQATASTAQTVVARQSHDADFNDSATPLRFHYQLDDGPGDGTVTLLSASRTTQYRTPGSISRYFLGTENATEHNKMVHNWQTFEWIVHFPGVPEYMPGSRPAALNDPPSLPLERQGLIKVEIAGRESVAIESSSGSNGVNRFEVWPGSASAAQIPGLKTVYNPGDTFGRASGIMESLPSVITTATPGESILFRGRLNCTILNQLMRTFHGLGLLQEPPEGFIESPTPAETRALLANAMTPEGYQISYDYSKYHHRISIQYDQTSADGVVILRKRYALAVPRKGTPPTNMRWEFLVQPNQNPIAWVDYNGDDAVQTEEIVLPQVDTAAASGIDTNPPPLALEFSSSGSSTTARLASSGGGPARIFLSTDGGRFQEYAGQSFPIVLGNRGSLRAFAVDAAGNSSDAIDLSYDPQLSIDGYANVGLLNLEWRNVGLPLKLESATHPSGPWTPSTTTLEASGGMIRTSVPILGQPRGFFRLSLATP